MTSDQEATTAELPVIDILLVDDRPENLLALEAVLQAPGRRLVKVGSGDDALRYLLDNEPALILMDVQMPGMDGFETASIIKQSERTRDIPIIFITAINKEDRFVYRGYRGGAVDYIYKPFDAEIVRAKVAVFADLHRKNRMLLLAERVLREQEVREQERRLRELELRSLRREHVEQQKYRDLVHGIHQGVVWSAEPDSLVFSYVSPSVEAITGWTAERWMSESRFWVNHLHPEDREEVLSQMKKALSTGEEVTFEHRFLTASGRELWFRTGLRVGHRIDFGDELRGLSVDITAMKQAEQVLRRHKERADFMAEASLILSEGLDAGGLLQRISRSVIPAVARQFFVCQLGPEGKLEAIAGSLPGTTGLERRMRETLSRGAADRDAEAIVVPLKARGQVIAAMALCAGPDRRYDEEDLEFAEDLGRRVALALENARLFQQSQLAIRARDEFLSIASHELKTPLTPLKLQAQGLARLLTKGAVSEIEPDRLIRMISVSERQINRLSRLIDELLDISRINMGKLVLSPEEFEATEFLREVVERFSDQLKESGCELSLALPSPFQVRWDRFRMEQVVVNLLTNAMKYGAGQPIEASIEEDGSGGIRLRMRDGGIGIAKKDHDRIFKRFERAASMEAFGGLGLGLFIVAEIVHAHGGRIKVESELGQGSLFTVEMPEKVPEAPGLVTELDDKTLIAKAKS